MKYETRVVVYIDILGFKNLIGETINTNGADNQQKICLVEAALSIAYTTMDMNSEGSSAQVTQFSDLIVISFLTSETSGVYYAISNIQFLLVELALLGIFCRGGIALGKLMHTDRILFGPALVDAHILESNVAHYPRIVLDESIIKIAGLHSAPANTYEDEIEYVKRHLGRDSDGLYYVDYFLSVLSNFNDPELDALGYFTKLRDSIAEVLKSPKTDIRAKFLWLREKYNASIAKIHNPDFLNALCSDPEIRSDYLNLKEIQSPPDK